MSLLMRDSFLEGEYVVYPAHGVGKFLKRERQEVSGQEIELYVIDFPKEKMTLRLPSKKAQTSGLRRLSSKDAMKQVLLILKNRIPSRRMTWNRRSQEYENKINSGDPRAIAEVVRELAISKSSDQSYSERLVFQTALERLARELAVVEGIQEQEAIGRLENLLKL